MRGEDAEAVALEGGEPARGVLVAGLIEQVEELGRVVPEQAARIDELEWQLNRSSKNSSMAFSSDPPKSRAERRREARERAKKHSKRKPGGQPGHDGKARQMAPPERVDERFEHLPACGGCAHRFDGTEEPSATRCAIRSGSCPRSRR